MIPAWFKVAAAAVILVVVAPSDSLTQEPKPEPKPLVNADVIKMVKSGIAERTVIRAVQTSPNEFDVSPDALIALNNEGVSAKIQDAMISAANRSRARRAAGRPVSSRAGAGRAGAIEAALPPGLPLVDMLLGDQRVSVRPEKTTLAQSKKKPASLGELAKDRAFAEGVRTGVGAARKVGGQTTGSLLGGAAQTAAALFDSKDGSTITYVWMVAGLSSQVTFKAGHHEFEARVGPEGSLSAQEFAPALVKLTPSTGGARLVGATEGKVRHNTDPAVDWALYSRFIEDRVDVRLSSVTPGVWRGATHAPLPPGEYAVVLRPVAKDRRFSGAEIASNEGAGLAFNYVWAFSVR